MIVTLGSTTVDLMVTGVDRLPAADGDEFTTSSLIFCDRPLRIGLGGNGANSAYILARLGHASALCSARGGDDLGRLVDQWLSAGGVERRGVAVIDGASTASTTMIMDSARNRQSFYHPGALHAYRPEHLPYDLLDGAGALLISGYSLLPGFRPAGYTQLLEAARERGALTALDIGPAIGEPATTNELEPMLGEVDYLLANEHEARVATGRREAPAAAQGLLAAGAEAVVLKRGVDGACLYTQDEDPLPVPAFDVQANVTVGAGDAFNSGFLLAAVEGRPARSALQFASAVAALVVASERGVLTGPSREEVSELLDEGRSPRREEGD